MALKASELMGLVPLGAGAIAIWGLLSYASRKWRSLRTRKVGSSVAARRPRRAGTLWALIGVASLYVGLLRLYPSLTGQAVWDGGLGVGLGLYICAHPAANAVNLLFRERSSLHRVSSDSALMRWLVLNLGVLLVGWVVVFAGIRRLIGQPV